jgi:hypothetical protein
VEVLGLDREDGRIKERHGGLEVTRPKGVRGRIDNDVLTHGLAIGNDLEVAEVGEVGRPEGGGIRRWKRRRRAVESVPGRLDL